MAALNVTVKDVSTVLRRLQFTGWAIDEVARASIMMNSAAYTYPYAITMAGSSHFFYEDRSKGLGASLVADLAIGDRNLLTLGVDYRRAKAEVTADYSGRYALVMVPEDREGVDESLAFFAQDEWRILGDLALTAGLRYTRTRTSLEKNAAFPDRVGAETYENFVGSAGLVYTGIDNLSLRALYAQGFRAPILSGVMGKSQRRLPNPNLKSETSDNF